ncbi:MAG: DUF1801 domain-containing protein [Patescibacteria group bacterium]
MKSYTTISAYLKGAPKYAQPKLQEMRALCQEHVPDAEEVIRYGMPTIQLRGKNFVHFAAMKGHLGFYPTPSGVTAFEEQLKKQEISYSKGCIRFAYDKPLPVAFIKKIIIFRLKEERSR